MRRSIVITTMALGVLALTVPARAAAGDLDPSFGGDGRIELSGNQAKTARGPAVATDAEGRIIVAASVGSPADLQMQRLEPDGSLDQTFGDHGTAVVAVGSGDDFSDAVAVAPDGSIVVAGTSSMPAGTALTLVRLTTSGTPDPTFSGNGVARVHIGTGDDLAGGLVVQPDGAIVVTGTAPFRRDRLVVLRYLPNGSLDASFGGDGIRVFQTGKITVSGLPTLQPNGRIVIAVSTYSIGHSADIGAVRLRRDGALDRTFGSDGVVSTQIDPTGYGRAEYGFDVAISADGSILVAGYAYIDDYSAFGDCAIVAWRSDGTLDDSFNGNGKLHFGWRSNVDDRCSTVDVTSSGAIVLAGVAGGARFVAETFGFARLLPNGTFDRTFGRRGLAKVRFDRTSTDLTDATLDPSGKIVGVGNFAPAVQPDIVLARILTS